MNARTCVRCGGILKADNRGQVCPDCAEADRADFQTIMEYLSKNPRASIMELATATGLSLDVIRSYLRQGRLATRSDQSIAGGASSEPTGPSDSGRSGSKPRPSSRLRRPRR